ncbi:MAG: hypothetical protein PHN58_01545, partial [Candidatus Cloacimonetes bacterium]|nr:hypothetical protein [Candidatus Cloacimonadota bacterium]
QKHKELLYSNQLLHIEPLHPEVRQYHIRSFILSLNQFIINSVNIDIEIQSRKKDELKYDKFITK